MSRSYIKTNTQSRGLFKSQHHGKIYQLLQAAWFTVRLYTAAIESCKCNASCRMT